MESKTKYVFQLQPGDFVNLRELKSTFDRYELKKAPQIVEVVDVKPGMDTMLRVGFESGNIPIGQHGYTWQYGYFKQSVTVWTREDLEIEQSIEFENMTDEQQRNHHSKVADKMVSDIMEDFHNDPDILGIGDENVERVIKALVTCGVCEDVMKLRAYVRAHALSDEQG